MKKLSELIWKAKGWGIEGKKGNEITINGKQPLGYEEVQDWARDCIKELEKERGSKELNLYNDAQIIWIKENILEEE